jgi:hypothetical protein
MRSELSNEISTGGGVQREACVTDIMAMAGGIASARPALEPSDLKIAEIGTASN